MIDIPLNAKVECADGTCAETVTVIVDPVARKVTHFVVEDQNVVQRIVPVDQVVETTPDSIYLRCRKEELAHMEPFVERHYIKNEQLDRDDDVDHYMYAQPYATPTQITTMPVEVEHVPPGEIAVRRGTPVEATDGHVGKVGELLVDPSTGMITHLVLQEGHLWRKKEITLPLSAIDRIQDDTVYLRLDKKGIESLPSIPVQRHYGLRRGWEAAELVARVYDDPDRADEELEFVNWLHREGTINVLNSAVLVRDEEGETSLRETGDLDARKGRVFGAITLGLLGLVVAPGAAVVGAVAGAAAGDFTSKWIDMGFSDEFLTGLQERLQPGTSALILLVEHGSTVKLSEAFATDEGVMFQQTLTDKLVEELLRASEAEE
jgi:uncharacterized membrane protein/sporulation protein YlmC with PRC-barrel domain